MRPQNSPHRLAAEPGAAAFIRGGETPAADPMLLPLDAGPSDRAGPDDDDPAVLPAAGAAAGRVGVAHDDRGAKRLGAAARGGKMRRLARAGERQTGDGPAQGWRRAPRP